MEAARELADDGKPLQLNVVAQHASVGVGTVYRHFPTPEALAEALAADRIDVLVKEVDAAPRTLQGLRNFLKVALTVFVRDDTSASALINPVTDDLRHQRRRLLDGLRTLIAGIIATDPLMFPTLGPRDIILLLCGAGSAMRHNPDRDDPAVPDRYSKALLVGILPRRIAYNSPNAERAGCSRR
ncbi:TetR family transcriptional regulator [Mycolicibacterium goodii]|uniref:TetR family transcriptional regulator n=2 Tax=Mycolicibacterium goodii TaxID=134601 RepID=A0A0K0XGH7_MYCGD|nr:TetR family transcriptional regulator [Mycolicibacterium goodii]